MFEVSKKQTVDEIYAQIEQELRGQYILGYVPDKSPVGAYYHKIHLATKQKDMTVQARDGYYADQHSSASAPPSKSAPLAARDCVCIGGTFASLAPIERARKPSSGRVS